VAQQALAARDGITPGVLAIGPDITDRKKAENELRQAKILAEKLTRKNPDSLQLRAMI
jgi:hypothetical protein